MPLNSKRTLTVILNEPYRIFFPLGMIIGLVGIGHWLFYSLGLRSTYSVYFHSFLQMHVFLGCFVAGFLLTSIPRFSGARHATLPEVLAILLLLLIQLVFLSTGVWLGAALCYIAFLLSMGCFIVVRFRKEKVREEPTEFVWIPMGIFHGITGTIIYAAARLRWAPAWMLEVGEEMTELGFIFCVVLGIGGFLAPRLLGRQKLLVRPIEGHSLEKISKIRRRRMAVHLMAGLILFVSFWLEGLEARVLSFTLRALVITAEFVWTGSLPFPPRTEGAHAKLLWLSIWMVAAGSWVLVFFPDQEKTMLHIIFIGGFSLMIFSVATVVVLSHAGEAARLHHRIWTLRVVLVAVLSALTCRIIASYFPEQYFSILAHASAFWILAAISWLILAVPKLLTVPGSIPTEDGSCHTD